MSSPTERMEIAKRRALLMQIVDHARTSLSYEEMAAKMRDSRWVSARWPGYTVNHARDDHLNNLALVEDDVRALAGIYLVRHLEIIDRSINRLEKIADATDTKTHIKVSATTAIGPFLEKSLKIFGNYSATDVKIEKHSLSINMDQFQEISEQVKKDKETIEGEIVKDNPLIEENITTEDNE